MFPIVAIRFQAQTLPRLLVFFAVAFSCSFIVVAISHLIHVLLVLNNVFARSVVDIAFECYLSFDQRRTFAC